MMSRVQKGVVAGLAATITVSLLEAANLLLFKWFTPFPMIIANILGMGGNLAVGWVLHFLAGVFILGPLFAVLYGRLPTDTPETKGIAFAVGAWVVAMVLMMFVGDRLAFGQNIMTIGWMLATHAVFGVVLGNVYARLVDRERRAATFVDGATAH